MHGAFEIDSPFAEEVRPIASKPQSPPKRKKKFPYFKWNSRAVNSIESQQPQKKK